MKLSIATIIFGVFFIGLLVGVQLSKEVAPKDYHCEMYGDENMYRCKPGIYNDCPAYGEQGSDGWCYPI